MSRRKPKGLPINGWLILDKPTGMNSTKAVSHLKWLFDAQKAGHAGTLDPLATGILPIAFGEATKTVPYVFDGMKRYVFTIAWGAETDTDDSQGQVTRTSDVIPELAAIEAALPEFIGDIEQVPPQYSAIKVDGARAYDLARDGETFELKSRSVFVQSLVISGIPDARACVLEAHCGKGTYVRAIARDLGRRLGCLGHVTALRRTQVGGFTEAHSISLDRLDELGHNAESRAGLMQCLKPVEAALDDIPAVPISSSDAARLKRGQSVILRGASAPILTGPIYATCRGTLVAVGEIQQGEFLPVRVFNLPQPPGRSPSSGDYD
jgi:tRNA pseudouridine55 synthase